MNKEKINLEEVLKLLKKQIKIRSFEQISQNECLQYYETVIFNSKEHIEISAILAENKKYGSAIVHQILAAEEMTKALVLYVNGKGLNISNIKGFKSFFYKHKPRHILAQFMLTFYTIMKPFMDFYKQIKSIDNLETFNYADFFNQYQEQIEQIADNDWWYNADSLKNKGLYVDYSNRIYTPSSLNENDFRESLKNVSEYGTFCLELIKTIENLNVTELNTLIEISKTESFRNSISNLTKCYE